MAFLTEDLLAVCVNQRVFLDSPAPMNTDQPNSKVLVVDVKTGRLVASAALPVRKYIGSFHAVFGERLAVLSATGLQLCTRELRCAAAMRGPGPVFVSPQGRRIVLGGDGMTRRAVFDVDPVREVRSFENPSQFAEYGSGVIPGDGALLVSQGVTSFAIEQPGSEARLIQFDRGGSFIESRFLNDDMIAYLNESSNSVTITKLDGSWLRRYEVEKRIARASFQRPVEKDSASTNRATPFGTHWSTSWTSTVRGQRICSECE